MDIKPLKFGSPLHSGHSTKNRLGAQLTCDGRLNSYVHRRRVELNQPARLMPGRFILWILNC